MTSLSPLNASEPTPLTPTQRTLKVAGALTGVALAVLILGWLLPAALKVSWADIGAVLSGASVAWVLTLVLAAVFASLLDSVGFWLCFRTLPLGQATLTNLAAQAVGTSVPLGSTLSLTVLWKGLRSLPRTRIVAGLTLASVADLVTLVIVPALALLALVFVPEQLAWWLRVAAGIGALLVAFAGVVALRILGKESTFIALVGKAQEVYIAFQEGFGEQSRDLHAPARNMREAALTDTRAPLPIVLATPSAARLLQALAFVAWCAWGLGLDASPLALFAVYALGRLLTLIPLTPGGIGVADAGVAWALTLTGVPPEEAIAATLLFTLTQTLTPVLLGALSLPLVLGRDYRRAASSTPPQAS